MPRFIRKRPGTSEEWWEIELRGLSIVERTEAGRATFNRDDPAAARTEYKRMIASKVKQGFRELEPAALAPPREASEPALEAAIVRDPENVESRLVYADWLQANGDPRGELAILQHRKDSRTGGVQIERAIHELLYVHREHLLGPALFANEERFTFTWRLGFLDSLDDLAAEAGADAGQRVLEKALASASARFLRTLRIARIHSGENPAVMAALSARTIPTLRSLRLADDSVRPANFVDLRALSRSFPELRRLAFHAEVLAGPHELEWPLLEGMHVRCPGMQNGPLSLILNSELPALRELSLWIHNQYGQSRVDGGVFRLLARSPLVKQVTSLDLSGSFLQADVEALVEVAAGLAHLERLELGGVMVNAAERRQIADVLPNATGLTTPQMRPPPRNRR